MILKRPQNQELSVTDMAGFSYYVVLYMQSVLLMSAIYAKCPCYLVLYMKSVRMQCFVCKVSLLWLGRRTEAAMAPCGMLAGDRFNGRARSAAPLPGAVFTGVPCCAPCAAAEREPLLAEVAQLVYVYGGACAVRSLVGR